MAAKPGHGLSQLGDRVVRLQHGSVPRCPARGQPHPGDALLRCLDQVEPAPADRGAEPADLANRLGDALEQLGVVVHQPASAPTPARLLVGGEREHHVARPPPLPQPLPDDGQDHRVHILHVDRAAPPDAAILGLPGERVHPPVGRIRGDHVEMTVDEQAGPRPVLALDPDHDAGAFRVRLEHGGLQPNLGEQLRDALGRRALPGPEWSPGLVVSILISSLARAATSSCAVGPPESPTGAFSVIPPSSHHVLRPRPPRPGPPAAPSPAPSAAVARRRPRRWPGAVRCGAPAPPGQSPVAVTARICYRDAASPASAVARTRPGGGIGRRASLRC